MPGRHQRGVSLGPASVRVTRTFVTRRRVLRSLLLPAAACVAPGIAWANVARIASARMWPAQEYTRLIIEGSSAIPHQLLVLKEPHRIALDLDNVDLSDELLRLASRVQATDPYIAGIRYGRKQDGVRMVIDLRSEVTPQLFSLQPIADFGFRLVLDLYPVNPVDPLMALVEGNEARNAKPAGGRTAASAELKQPARTEGQRPIVIAIDPGHGGEDPGAVGRKGTAEKDVVLAIARKLKTLLDATPGTRAMLTRDDDYYVPLAARVQKARRVSADLFISIHADAFTVPTARGSSVFALSENGATSAAANWLAQKENAADLIGGVNLGARDPVLARTLLDLSQTAQINDSLKVGRSVLEGLAAINPLHKNSVEQAGFAVLKAPDIPSILVETAFISNPEEEQKLRSDRYQKRFAESIHEGIRSYFASNPPLARGRSVIG